MSNLSPNASAGEIEEEIDFTQILLESLDSESDAYEARRQELEKEMAQLHRRLELVQSGRWDPSMVTSAQTISPGSSTGNKRPVTDLLSVEQPAPKRHTPSPHPDTSSESFRRAQERQLRAEAAIRRQLQATQQDEAFARQLQGMAAGPSSSQSVYQSTIGQNGSVRPPVRPSYSNSSNAVPQQVSPTPYIKPEAAPQQQTIPHRTRASEFVDLTGDSDDEHQASRRLPALPFNTVPRGYPWNTGQPIPQMPTYSMPGAFPSTQNGGGVYARPGPYNQIMPQGPPLPNSWATQPSGSSTGRTAADMLQALRNSITGASNGLAAVRHAAQQEINERYTELGRLVGHGGGDLFAGRDDYSDSDDSVMISGSRRLNPYNPYADNADLYNARYAQIEHYNPEKTKEEINALLMNIRPDEDLSDDLLVSTPSEMTIKLHKYQELGLTWLQKAEDGPSKAGILADDMGLGKTIQMISLIVTRKSEDPRNKTTLIVAPVALLRQWKQEIRDKVKPGRHALSVFIHHGQQKKKTYKELQAFDVVITTFGSMAAEVKRLEKFELRQQHDSEARPNKNEQCSLIGPDCRWYRIILDEAQCIKNKGTQTAKAACRLEATYRWCMTGTPMMNNAGELFSLVKFLRIKPYNNWEKFNLELARPIKGSYEDERKAAMKRLQTLCRAIMLRRTKKSKYRGKPILVLPERTTLVDHAVFDDDELAIYTALEQKTQLTFNKYLRAGQVGRQYSAMLVLLLRLRQACCHPHLIKDFSISAAADLTDDDLVKLAEELEPQVVARIKETEGNFECSICMDACLNPAIFLPCGHDTCRECYVKLADPGNALREGNEGAVKARCPHCRGDIDPKRITDFTSFKRVWMPELLTEEEKTLYNIKDEQAGSETESEEDVDDDDETETESEEEDDSDPTLGGFVVKDDASETESEAEEADQDEDFDDLAGSSSRKVAKKVKKPRKSKKSRGKQKAVVKSAKKLTLAELKARANRNIKAKKRYLKRLRENYTDSAKIRKMMELLTGIIDKDDDEELNDEGLDVKPKFEKGEGEKILVFSQWTSLLDLCEIEIDAKGWDYRRYDGSMNAKMRADAVDDFKDKQKDVRIMLVSLKAGNAGLNLNVASQVIIMDPFWNPYIEEQAIDRAHRIGQVRPVKVHRILVPVTVEDRIIELQEKKRELIETALDENQASQLGRLGTRELAYLFGVTSNINENVREGPAH